nr:MAG TPA: hypothetical protein [Inoviridae sp.]
MLNIPQFGIIGYCRLLTYIFELEPTLQAI